MVQRRDVSPVNPFPVAPADVPMRGVLFVERTMRRRGQPVDRDLARVLVAGLIGLLTSGESAAAAAYRSPAADGR